MRMAETAQACETRVAIKPHSFKGFKSSESLRLTAMQFDKVQHQVLEYANGCGDGKSWVNKSSVQTERDGKINQDQ